MRPILELEVDATLGGAGDGVEPCLVPYIGKVVILALLLHFFIGLVAAEEIEKKDTIIHQRVIDTLEVANHRGAFLEDPIAEVHGQHHIHRLRVHLHHIALHELDALLLLGCQLGDVVVTAPLLYLRIQIDTGRGIRGAAANPLTGGVARPTEILA